MDAVLRGDVERFSGIVARWEGPLLKLAWRFVHDRERAEEMAQEAFVQCFQRLRQWRREARFGTWLFSLALNVYRSRLRTMGRTAPHEPLPGELSGP
ncbi:MAG: RNA polymerase sigma factor, partial [Thermoanaerobaculia bacterium]